MNPILVLLLILRALVAPAATPTDFVERETWVMGTRLGIAIEAESDSVAGALAEAALLEVARFEHLLSTWMPETPLSRLNRADVDVWVDVEPELGELLWEAMRWSAHTDGTFDPRSGALVDAWDLRGAGRVPSPSELSARLDAVGDRAFQAERTRVRRRSADAWIDSGGFGKGAALRSVSKILIRSGPGARAIVDLGGQLLLIAPSESPWAVHVAHPVERSQAVATLVVEHGSVATSGTSERGRHVLDPRNGRTVESWGSVTVVHADPLAADVLSTALFVMGPDEGPRWARREGIAALFLELAEHRVRATWTPDLEPALARLDGSIERMNDTIENTGRIHDE